MSTIVLVLAYPTFVEIDLNEVHDAGNCNDEMQTIEYTIVKNQIKKTHIYSLRVRLQTVA